MRGSPVDDDDHLRTDQTHPCSSERGEPRALDQQGAAVATPTRPGTGFGITLGAANFGIQLVIHSVPHVLIAMQIEDIDPANKEIKLGILTAVAALLVCFAQPAWGVLSDRTRGRFGRRAPFIIGGALVSGIGLLSLAVADTFLALLLAWCATSIAFAATQATLGAVLPDRVPESVRGVFASIIGLGGVLGSICGQVMVSKLVGGGYLLPYAVIALVFAATAAAYVLLNPAEPGIPVAKAEKFSVRALWIDPREYPDFAWVFIGRLLVLTGFVMVNSYLLYILGDHIGLGRAGALHYLPLVSALSAVSVVASLIISGIWSDRVARRKPFVFGAALILAAGLGLSQFVSSIGGLLACIVIIAIGYGAFRSLDEALLSYVLPSKESAAQHIGIAHLATHIAAALAPVIAGVVIGSGGGYPLFFAIACVVCIAGALCILPIRSVR